MKEFLPNSKGLALQLFKKNFSAGEGQTEPWVPLRAEMLCLLPLATMEFTKPKLLRKGHWQH